MKTFTLLPTVCECFYTLSARKMLQLISRWQIHWLSSSCSWPTPLTPHECSCTKCWKSWWNLHWFASYCCSTALNGSGEPYLGGWRCSSTSGGTVFLNMTDLLITYTYLLPHVFIARDDAMWLYRHFTCQPLHIRSASGLVSSDISPRMWQSGCPCGSSSVTLQLSLSTGKSLPP